MRILVISYMLPPGLYPQAIQIGRLLSYVSEEIAVVSGCNAAAGASLDCYGELDSKLAFHLEVPYRCRLRGLGFYLVRRFVPFYARVPDEFRAWVPLAERAVMAKLAETSFRPDVLVTFGEPMSDHLLGLRLKTRLQVPWVAHFSDPWVDNPFRSGNFLSNLVNARDERRTIAAADRVIFTSQETQKLVMRKFPENWRDKTAVLSHSFDKSLYPGQTTSSDRIIVRHLGNFYGNRTPYPLLHALRRLLERNPVSLDGVTFELVGRVQQGLWWHLLCRGLPPGLVEVRGTVRYSESLRLMTEADLLLVMDAPANLSVFLPSKLIDYLGSETPIMGIVPPGTSASLLGRLGAFVADPRDSDEVVSMLGVALESIRQRRRSAIVDVWGKPAVRDEFRSDRMATAFIDLLRDVVGKSARGQHETVVV